MKGFTLFEILVVCAVFTVLLFAIFQVLDTGIGSWVSGDVSTEVRQELIKTFMRMERELKETRPAQISLGSGANSVSLTFKVPQDINGDGTILDSSGYVEWSADITYALNASNQITRTVSGHAPVVIANNITSLQFSRPASPVNILQIDITAQKNSAKGQPFSDSGQIMVKMRN